MPNTNETTTSSKDYLNQLYDSQLASTKEQLTQAYNESASGLDSESEKLKKQKKQDLVETDVEAKRAQRNYAEVQNAYGLTSGAMAQARLAQDNQHQNDMTDIRTTYLEADADVERRRSLLSQQFESAIKEAQANNDLARAQALYELAREEEAALLAQQQAGAATPGGSASGGSSSSANAGSSGGNSTPAPTPTPDTGSGEGVLADVKKPIASVGDQITDAINNAVNGVGSVPKPVVSTSAISAQDYLDAAGAAGAAVSSSKAPTRPSGSTDAGSVNGKLTVDKSSINDLGRGPITEAELNRLIASGEVEEYIVGNTIRFRNVVSIQPVAPTPVTPSVSGSYSKATNSTNSKKTNAKKSGGGSSVVADSRTDPKYAVSAYK